MQLTADESHYVLATLLRKGKLRASVVRATLRGRREEIRELREWLAALEGPGAGSAAPVRRVAVRRRRLSPRVRRLRRLQGRYMGLVRRLPAAKKAKVRAMREKRGMGPAIRLAASFAKKKS
jgi:hypothetical protein